MIHLEEQRVRNFKETRGKDVKELDSVVSHLKPYHKMRAVLKYKMNNFDYFKLKFLLSVKLLLTRIEGMGQMQTSAERRLAVSTD